MLNPAKEFVIFHYSNARPANIRSHDGKRELVWYLIVSKAHGSNDGNENLQLQFRPGDAAR